MFLTHIDEMGEDSPPILIENTTAANRAVNIPEFVNIPPGGIERIDAPAAQYALHMDKAVALLRNRKLEAALKEWNSALELAPEESLVQNGLGFTLSKMGKFDEAIQHFKKALILDPQSAEACNNLGDALARKKNTKEAIIQFERAAKMDLGYTPAHENLRIFLTHTGQTDKAIVHLKKVVEARPDSADVRRILGHAFLDKGDLREAGNQLEEAARLAGGKDPLTLHLLGRVYAGIGRIQDGIRLQKEAFSIAKRQKNSSVIQLINKHMASLDLEQ
jgi:tetratricopeptide (TPR) repeat protein